jgi:hypothetical protein
MDPASPLAREIVQNIVRSADPGAAVMELHGNSLVRSLSTGHRPPFLPPVRNVASAFPGRSTAPRPNGGAWASGYGDRDTEVDVFNSAFEPGWED